ncbi:hypothetical protein Ancab_008863 [Ancistrocladus abbreviatus]
MELTNAAASNPHLIFCFCHVIIAVLLFGSSKTTSHIADDHTYAISARFEANISVKVNENGVAIAEDYSSEKAAIETEEEKENAEDDDELRRRIEAFINKVNKEWREEKLRSSSCYFAGRENQEFPQ